MSKKKKKEEKKTSLEIMPQIASSTDEHNEKLVAVVNKFDNNFNLFRPIKSFET